MKMMNEIKKESGYDFNLHSNSEKEKSSKLKFEPNLNLKRNYKIHLKNKINFLIIILFFIQLNTIIIFFKL